MNNQSYDEFLRAKVVTTQPAGFDIDDAEIHPTLKPHQRDMVKWGVHMGRAGYFAAFGLGKSLIQIETVRIIRQRAGGMGLIVMPLGVRQEFVRDAQMIGVTVKFIRRIEDATDPDGIYLTNYETIRDEKLDPRKFSVTSLDEAAVLRGFGSSKTFRAFMRLFEGVRYKFVATATPAPNQYIELLAYSAYLEVMDVSEAKTRFFKRNSEKADTLTIHPHKEREFWLWISTWGLFVQRPSDLGFSDEGYELPEIDVRWHEIPSDHKDAGIDPDGQLRLLKEAAIGVVDASREKRDSLDARVAKMMEIRAEDPDAHRIIWHDLEREREAIQAAIPGITAVYGSQTDEEKERGILSFADGASQELAGKPQMLGSGCNFQRHCHWAIYLGIGFKFNDFIQSIHRLQRFLQTSRVRIDLIYTESEQPVREILEKKWHQHKAMMANMSKLIREFGLSHSARQESMRKAMGVADPVTIQTDQYRIINDDTVYATREMESESVGLILTSIPFSTQYEYSPNYADFGHSDSNEHFFEQMGYLTPELLRVLSPGRMAVIHVKDRIVPGGMTGLGFQTVYPFHARCIDHYTSHGFAYMGMITVVTDVVRENNQTYRLGWTEQCKDATKMGVGMPEYLLLFRKPQTATDRAYTDDPVVKHKPLVYGENGPEKMVRQDKRPAVPGSGYSTARWQLEAHAFERSSGNRLPTRADMATAEHQALFKLWRKYNMETIYDYEEHVAICEALESHARLPRDFMLFQPTSWHPDVWTDVARMRCLNGEQQHKGKQQHLCLAKGSRVLTKERGYIPIEHVEAGEHTLTHLGRWRKILTVQPTGVAPVITVKAHGVPGLTLTPDHKLWCRKSNKARQRVGAQSADPSWIESQNTLSGYLNQKTPPVEPASNNDVVHWWLVGRWIADGHWDARGAALISCPETKMDEFDNIAGSRKGGVYDTGTCFQIRLLDPTGSLKETLRQCGSTAEHKRLPPEAYTLPVEQASALLSGYLSGDGNLVQDRNRYQASSVSRDLLLGLSFIVQRVHKTILSISPGRGKRKSIIAGRTVSCKQEWTASFDLPNPDARKTPFVIDDGAWKRVRSIEDAGDVETWNMRVEEDESYTAEGCIVKNCPMQYDIADRIITRLSNKGDVVFDPFGGLMTVPYRAIMHGRYGVGHELNPQYFADGAYYCETAARKLAQPSLFDFLDLEHPQAMEDAA